MELAQIEGGVAESRSPQRHVHKRLELGEFPDGLHPAEAMPPTLLSTSAVGAYFGLGGSLDDVH